MQRKNVIRARSMVNTFENLAHVVADPLPGVHQEPEKVLAPANVKLLMSAKMVQAIAMVAVQLGEVHEPRTPRELLIAMRERRATQG